MKQCTVHVNVSVGMSTLNCAQYMSMLVWRWAQYVVHRTCKYCSLGMGTVCGARYMSILVWGWVHYKVHSTCKYGIVGMGTVHVNVSVGMGTLRSAQYM